MSIIFIKQYLHNFFSSVQRTKIMTFFVTFYNLEKGVQLQRNFNKRKIMRFNAKGLLLGNRLNLEINSMRTSDSRSTEQWLEKWKEKRKR